MQSIRGEGTVTNCGAAERHANDPMSGYCRHHAFEAKECGGKLPATDAHANHCIVLNARICTVWRGAKDISLSYYERWGSRSNHGTQLDGPKLELEMAVIVAQPE